MKRFSKLVLAGVFVTAAAVLTGCGHNTSQTTELAPQVTEQEAAELELTAQQTIESQDASDLEAIDATLDSLEASFTTLDTSDINEDLSELQY